MKIWLFGLIIWCGTVAYFCRNQVTETDKIAYIVNLVCVGINARGLLHEYAK
jgi:hypothetical protein